MTSQADRILTMLEAGEYVTPETVYQKVGSHACHSRIAELRARGLDIRCTIQRSGAMKWGVYTLAADGSK